MIVTVGSINMDLVVKVDHLPAAGETILGSEYATHHGGKGANQAVAAARAGTSVRMIGAVGSDAFGEQLRSALEQDGIDVQYVSRSGGKSGVAFISVDSAGQNSIIVSPGANGELLPQRLEPSAFAGARVVVLQLEIPLKSVKEAARMGRMAGAIVILNAAPGQQLGRHYLGDVDVLVVNELEAAAMLGVGSRQDPQVALELARKLLAFAPRVVVTLGAQGSVWAVAEGAGDEERELERAGHAERGPESAVHGDRRLESAGHEPAFEVEVVDTTAAGDAFVGMLASRLAQGALLGDAVRWGNAAGALAASKAGARASIPLLTKVEELLASARM